MNVKQLIGYAHKNNKEKYKMPSKKKDNKDKLQDAKTPCPVNATHTDRKNDKKKVVKKNIKKHTDNSDHAVTGFFSKEENPIDWITNNLLSYKRVVKNVVIKPQTDKHNKDVAAISTRQPSPYCFNNENEDLEKHKTKMVSLIKSFHDHYSKVMYNQPLSRSARTSERALQRYMTLLHEKIDDLDEFMEDIYRDPRLNAEQKALARDLLIRVFSINYIEPSHPSDLPYIVDVFALPMYGTPSDAYTLLNNNKAREQVAKLACDSGFISDRSERVVVLNRVLRREALSQPSVMNALCAMWGGLLTYEKDVHEVTIQEINQMVDEALAPYDVDITDQSSGFVAVGVRLWKGDSESYRTNGEVFNSWYKSDTIRPMSSNIWWNTACSHIVTACGVSAPNVMMRPPAPPLTAQAQTLGWHMSNQMYARLGTAPFHKVQLMTEANNEQYFVLRSYDYKGKLLAQSDHVHLFDVIAAADDFTEVVHFECGENGPRSILREQSKSKLKEQKA